MSYRTYRAGRKQNWRGPRRALTLDEQLEIQRLMRQAHAEHVGRHELAIDLATRYGVSVRTIWRYVATIPVPPNLEFLRMRLSDWAKERHIRLSTDDMLTLLLTVARHRDWMAAEPAEKAA